MKFKPKSLLKADSGDKPPVFDITYFDMKSAEIQQRFETVVKTNKTIAACVELAKQKRITWTDALKLAVTRIDKDYEYLYLKNQKQPQCALGPNSFFSTLFQILPQKNKFVVMSLLHDNKYFSTKFVQKGEEHEVIQVNRRDGNYLLDCKIERAELFNNVADAEEAIKEYILRKLK